MPAKPWREAYGEKLVGITAPKVNDARSVDKFLVRPIRAIEMTHVIRVSHPDIVVGKPPYSSVLER